MFLLRISVFFRNSRGMSLEHWILHWQTWTKTSCANTRYWHPIRMHGTPRQSHKSTLSADFPMELECSEEQGSVQQGRVWNWSLSAELEHLRKFEICGRVDYKETSEFKKELQTEISSIHYWVLKMLAAEKFSSQFKNSSDMSISSPTLHIQLQFELKCSRVN